MSRKIAKAAEIPFIVMNELAKRKVYMGEKASFTYNVVKPGPYNPPHSHETETQFVFVIQGKMRFVIDGEEVIGEPGDLIVFEPGEGHGGHVISEEEGISLDIFVPALPEHGATAVMIGKKAE